MRFSKTTTSVEKCFVRFLSGEGIFFRDKLWRGWAGQERDEYFSRWPSPISVGGPVLQWLKSCCILGAFTAAATTTTVAVLYGHAVVFPSVFLYVPSRFLCPFSPFFFFPSCNLSLGFRSLGSAHDAYIAGKVLSWKWNVVISSRGPWLYRRVVKTAKGNRPRAWKISLVVDNELLSIWTGIREEEARANDFTSGT